MRGKNTEANQNFDKKKKERIMEHQYIRTESSS